MWQGFFPYLASRTYFLRAVCSKGTELAQSSQAEVSFLVEQWKEAPAHRVLLRKGACKPNPMEPEEVSVEVDHKWLIKHISFLRRLKAIRRTAEVR